MDFATVKTVILDRLQKDLPEDLYYHTVAHTVDVLNAVDRLANAEKINEKDTILLKTSALFHDVGFLEQYEHNEVLGCKLAAEMLPARGYSDSDIQIISDMIMATEIPQTPKTKLEEIICDADLDYLGRDDFFSISERLRDELRSHSKEFSEEEWLTFEINFLKKHRYFTKTAQNLRNDKKLEHLKELERQLKRLKTDSAI